MNKFMQQAIKEAEKGIKNNHGGPFGSVVVKNNEIISLAHNEVVKNNDCTCHGEMLAIKKACKKLNNFNLKGCDIYTTSEPCPMCMGAILWANINSVYYGCTINDAENIGFRDEDFYEVLSFNKNNLKNYIQVDRDECLKLFEKYKNLNNKTIY